MNFNKYQLLSCTIEKVVDSKFNNQHPNGINTGYKEIVEVDVYRSNLDNVLYAFNDRIEFHTSTVTRIEECEGYDLIHTKNSVYKLTPSFTAIPGVQEKYSLKF